MGRARAVHAQRREVLGRRVTLVLGKTVGRMLVVQGRQERISVNLGNDRRRLSRGTWLPSTSTRAGSRRRPSTARRIASRVA
jgi:hypothetical protein